MLSWPQAQTYERQNESWNLEDGRNEMWKNSDGHCAERTVYTEIVQESSEKRNQGGQNNRQSIKMLRLSWPP